MLKGDASAIARKAVAMARAVEATDRTTLSKGALTSKRRIEQARDAATGDGRLSGMRNARLGVSFTVRGDGALVRATGPWQIVESNTKRHTIRRKARNRGGGLSIPGIGVRRSADHPGTTGKHPWRKGAAAAAPEAAKEMRKVQTTVIQRAFRA